ncbi:hypothetical protein [uncultured Sneathiella sp.]|jgi:hypothetical protein
MKRPETEIVVLLRRVHSLMKEDPVRYRFAVLYLAACLETVREDEK